MEQPCYKCGQAVEEGIPFCPHCAAPQIRVVLPESLPELAAVTPDGGVVLPAGPGVPHIALPMRWSATVLPSALAALVASILMSFGLNPFVAMLSVGFLAVVFYRQRRKGTVVRTATGAAIGSVAGLLWFMMSSVLEAFVVIFLHKGPEIRNELLLRIEQASSRTSDPQVLAMFSRLKTPSGLEFLMLFGLAFAFVASIVLAGVGGAVGAAILGRRDRP